MGGPWRWHPAPGRLYALGLAPEQLAGDTCFVASLVAPSKQREPVLAPEHGPVAVDVAAVAAAEIGRAHV